MAEWGQRHEKGRVRQEEVDRRVGGKDRGGEIAGLTHQNSLHS